MDSDCAPCGQAESEPVVVRGLLAAVYFLHRLARSALDTPCCLQYGRFFADLIAQLVESWTCALWQHDSYQRSYFDFGFCDCLDVVSLVDLANLD